MNENNYNNLYYEFKKEIYDNQEFNKYEIKQNNNLVSSVKNKYLTKYKPLLDKMQKENDKDNKDDKDDKDTDDS